MDWASASGALSWDAAAADLGSTVLSFAGPSSCTANATEVSLREFASILVQPVVRPAGAAGARRSRVAVGGEACSVDGCRSDLTHCREYHRRHKVCEEHSKTPVVVVGGQEQRFCQQCSRFHMLSEFDNGKRSCRKRLDGHNRRRRKSQHDVTNLGRFFPYNQVNEFVVNPQIIPTTARQNSDAIHSAFSISFSGDFKSPNQFLFAKDCGGMLSTACTSNLLFGTVGPEYALSLLSPSLHHPSPAGVPTAGQAQVASSLSRITAVSQSEKTAANTAFTSRGIDLAFAPEAAFEDRSQALPFPWKY